MRSARTILPAALVLAAAGALAACGSSGSGAADLKAPTITSTTTKTVQPPGPKTSFGPGKYKVGTDIAAGNYQTPGPADPSVPICYWARESDNSGEVGAIIANNDSSGQTSVTVNTGEYFETSGCQTWHRG